MSASWRTKRTGTDRAPVISSIVKQVWRQHGDFCPTSLGELVYDEQRRLGNTTIQFNVIDSSNHRGTYLAAVANALTYFNSLMGN